MSLTSSPDCLFRPEDKALKMLFPSGQESSSFDEFFHEELYNFSDDESNEENLSNFANHLNLDTSASFVYSSANEANKAHVSPQPWRKGLWCLNQGTSTGPSEQFAKPEARKEDTRSEFTHRGSYIKTASHGLPESPCTIKLQQSMTDPAKGMYRQNYASRPSISREATLSPSPMYVGLSGNGREKVEKWHQDFQQFHLHQPDRLLSSSPHQSSTTYQRISSRIPSGSRNNNTIQEADIGLAITSNEKLYLWNSGHSVGDPVLVNSQVMDPGANIKAIFNTQTVPTVHESRTVPVWTSESLHSSNSSHQSYETSTYNSNDDFGSQVAHFEHLMSPAINYVLQPPGRINHQPTNLIAPVAQRAVPSLLQHEPDFGHNGLGIQYPELDQFHEAIFHEPQPRIHHPNISFGTAVPYSPTAITVPYAVGTTYSALPPVLSYNYSENSPITPRKQRQSPSRSVSPSVSPTTLHSRGLRQRSPTKTDYSSTHHRRKSIHKIGPMKDTYQNTPPIPPLAVNSNSPQKLRSPTHARTRSRSTSKPPTPRGSRTPRTPTTPGVVDFVNFTAKDSMKLLSDVAPSGSSKTRARREQEAKEKRKRLSEAALKAVEKAGGDVRELKDLALS